MRRVIGRAAWAGCVAWCLGATAFGADGPSGVARWVAPETAIYLQISRPGTLLDRWNAEETQAALRRFPGYEKALEAPQFGQLKTLARLIATKLETTPEQAFKTLTGGGIVLTIEGKDRAVIAVKATDPAMLDRAHAALLEMARGDAREKGAPDPVKENDYNGIHAYSVHDKEAHAIIDGVLYVTSGGEMLKSVIDRLKDDGAKSLDENADFRAQHAEIAADAVAWSFVSMERLRTLDPDKFGKAKTPDAGQTLLFGPWISLAQGAPWLSATLSDSGESLALDVTLPKPKGEDFARFAGYVPPDGKGAVTPLKVPGQIATVSLYRDMSAVWDARGDLFPPEAQQGFAQLDTFAGQFFGGRDFATGVLGAIGTHWRLVVARQDEATLKPVPDVKLPAFALVIDLKPDDPDFAQRLKAAFQSFIGLANLGAAQTKAPPLLLGSETIDDVTIATSHFMPPKVVDGEPIHQRHNFSPSAAQVGDRFILSSSVGLARDLVKAVGAPAEVGEFTLVAEADGEELSGLVDLNKTRLVEQNMLDKGNSREKAEGEIATLSTLLRTLNHATLSVKDTPDSLRLKLQLDPRK